VDRRQGALGHLASSQRLTDVDSGALRSLARDLFWKTYGGVLRAAHGSYGSVWRTWGRAYIEPLVSYGRMFRFLRYVHHFDTFGHRVVMGSDVRVWGPLKIHVGSDCGMFDRVHILGVGELRLGDRSTLGHDTVVVVRERVTIGNHVQVAAHCYLTDVDHEFADSDVPIKDQGLHIAPIVIEDDVWLGAHTIVLRGVTIGRGTVVGANSVVTKSLPPNSICAGVPARVIKKRGAPGSPTASGSVPSGPGAAGDE
jgi:acetyltransferase-like isoleucine patch superfamily enzyme